MESRDMSTQQESTIANADLWTRYFQNEWSRWAAPADSSVSAMAEGTAARVASFLTLVAAGPIAWLYNANTTNVTPLREEPVVRAFSGDELESVEETAA
jgi:hypothetical protein